MDVEALDIPKLRPGPNPIASYTFMDLDSMNAILPVKVFLRRPGV